ncbi:hypothetical protein V6Z12_D03G143600 [Gossypium hirsutum]
MPSWLDSRTFLWNSLLSCKSLLLMGVSCLLRMCLYLYSGRHKGILPRTIQMMGGTQSTKMVHQTGQSHWPLSSYRASSPSYTCQAWLIMRVCNWYWQNLKMCASLQRNFHFTYCKNTVFPSMMKMW